MVYCVTLKVAVFVLVVATALGPCCLAAVCSNENIQCPEDRPCCSAYGYCGLSSDYCGAGCVAGASFNGKCSPPSQCPHGPCTADAPCCSAYGYCGSDSDYCTGCIASLSYKGSCGQTIPPAPKPPTPTAAGPAPKVCPNGGPCTADFPCCSSYNWCGDTKDHCGTGCQASLSFQGKCAMPATPAPVPTAKIAPTPVILNNNKSANLPAGPLFVGYYSSWFDQKISRLPKFPPYVNILIISFLKPDLSYKKGSLDISTATTGLIFDPYVTGATLKASIAALKKQNPRTRVIVSVGGSGYYNWAKVNYQRVVDFIVDFGLDGLDVDYEPYGYVIHCTFNANKVGSCPTDAEYIALITNYRALLPRPKILSIAAWGSGCDPRPCWDGDCRLGGNWNVLKAAGKHLDLLNIMSYESGAKFNPSTNTYDPAWYDPVADLGRFQSCFAGPLALGVEIPNEGWGGHVLTVTELRFLASKVKSMGVRGIMLWELNLAPSCTGCITPKQVAQTVCKDLGLSNCTNAYP